jgi:hypothetical protein
MATPRAYRRLRQRDPGARGIGRAAAEKDLKRRNSPSQSEGLAHSANRSQGREYLNAMYRQFIPAEAREPA